MTTLHIFMVLRTSLIYYMRRFVNVRGPPSRPPNFGCQTAVSSAAAAAALFANRPQHAIFYRSTWSSRTHQRVQQLHHRRNQKPIGGRGAARARRKQAKRLHDALPPPLLPPPPPSIPLPRNTPATAISASANPLLETRNEYAKQLSCTYLPIQYSLYTLSYRNNTDWYQPE